MCFYLLYLLDEPLPWVHRTRARFYIKTIFSGMGISIGLDTMFIQRSRYQVIRSQGIDYAGL